MSTYLNNAATTWPKPSCVAAAVSDFLTRGGANLGRGTSSERDLETLSVVLDCRTRLAEFFGGYKNGRSEADPLGVTFCANVTEGLNVVLKGYLRPGMRALTSRMEHNAVVRPLRALERQGVRVDFLECASDGYLDPSTVKAALSGANADLLVLSHASNVCGTVQPMTKIAELCAETGTPLVVDAAQTAGVLPIEVEKWNLAALCFTGHKGLMGPQGVGGIVWRPDFAARVDPLVEGGTGSFSHVETQPEEMPDKFEAGTPNLPGIAGLHAALGWLAETGVENVAARERELGHLLLDKLSSFKSAILHGATLYGRNTHADLDSGARLPVFAVNFDGPDGKTIDNGVLGDLLSRAGFETRPGLHCAPQAHRTLGSFPQGSLRVSPGWFNTEADIEAFGEALDRCARSGVSA